MFSNYIKALQEQYDTIEKHNILSNRYGLGQMVILAEVIKTLKRINENINNDDTIISI